MPTDDTRRLAARLGLGRLSDRHLEQLAAGDESNRQLLKRIPADLHWSELPAPQLRLRQRKSGETQ